MLLLITGRGWLAKDKPYSFPSDSESAISTCQIVLYSSMSRNVLFVILWTLCLKKKSIHNLFFALLMLLFYFLHGMKFSQLLRCLGPLFAVS